MVGVMKLIFGKKIPEVWFQHGPVGGRLDRIASYFKTDILFVNSEFTKVEHLKSSRHNFNALEYIPLSVYEKDLTPEYPKGSIRKLGFAGRICPWKGIHLIIEAAALLREDSPEIFKKFEISICGRAMTETDRLYEAKLKAQVERFGLENQIHFLGFHAKVEEFYRSIDLLLHTSTIPEPFGLVVGEAMAQKLLVLSAGEGGVSDLLKDGQTGFQFDGTAAGLAQKLLEVDAKSESELNTLRESAYQLVRMNHSLEAMTSKIEGCYQNLFE